MSQLFQRETSNVRGVFQADRCKMNFGGGLLGVLCQAIQFQYAQAVTRLYEIGTNLGNVASIYYVGGRTQGNATLNRVVGPGAAITAFYQRFGNICDACSNHVSVMFEETNCCAGGGSSEKLNYTLQFCVLTQMGIALTANDMIINETSQLMFSALEYTS